MITRDCTRCTDNQEIGIVHIVTSMHCRYGVTKKYRMLAWTVAEGEALAVLGAGFWGKKFRVYGLWLRVWDRGMCLEASAVPPFFRISGFGCRV